MVSRRGRWTCCPLGWHDIGRLHHQSRVTRAEIWTDHSSAMMQQHSERWLKVTMGRGSTSLQTTAVWGYDHRHSCEHVGLCRKLDKHEAVEVAEGLHPPTPTSTPSTYHLHNHQRTAQCYISNNATKKFYCIPARRLQRWHEANFRNFSAVTLGLEGFSHMRPYKVEDSSESS